MCREHASQLRGEYDRITAAGVGLAAIGTGDARYARHFVEDRDIPFPVLVDDEGEAAAIAAVRSGVAAVSDPRAMFGAVRATLRGNLQGRVGPRPTQQGATFVIESGGRVVYAHRDAHPSDHAPLDDVLAVAGVTGAQLN